MFIDDGDCKIEELSAKHLLRPSLVVKRDPRERFKDLADAASKFGRGMESSFRVLEGNGGGKILSFTQLYLGRLE